FSVPNRPARPAICLSYKFSDTFVDVDLAREIKLKCETIIHEALQKLKTPRRRPRITTRDVRELNIITKNNNKRLDKKPKITYGNNSAVNTVKKPIPHKQIENL
ncbi:3282_t:CDS:2, partial [Racocetra persica]